LSVSLALIKLGRFERVFLQSEAPRWGIPEERAYDKAEAKSSPTF
jgi:hypothetical protein